MSGKKRGAAGKGEDFKREDVLQAVVIADSFNVRFAPITRDKPRALLPLVNTPLIDYTLESLASAGIEEIIVFCCAHADQIKAHIQNSKWSSNSSPCEVMVMMSESCMSVGGALQEIDAKSLVQSDFVLVNGDLVANVELLQLIKEHKERRQQLKTPIMTLIYKEAPPGHQTRCREDDVLLAVSPKNDRILHYQKAHTRKKFDIPLEILQEHDDVQLRYDLLDCHISICSPSIPPLFTENFDYLTKDDFIRGILINEEILGNTIHLHVLKDQYAARVSNLHMYDAVSKDVLNRWSYPLTPDQNISGNNADYCIHGRHNIYLNKEVSLARGCVLEENVVIGRGTSIGSDSRITHSVIGRNCSIGENVTLENAYLWDNVIINDGCEVVMSVLAENVHVKNNVTIKPRSVLGSNVIVGPDVTLTTGTLLMSHPPSHDDDFADDGAQGTPAVIDQTIVGREGKAYVYQSPVDSDDEVDEVTMEMWALNIQSADEDESSGRESDSDEAEDDGDSSDNADADESKMFYDEVISTMDRGIQENIGTENMVLEINSLKHAYNIQIREVNMLVTKAIASLPAHRGQQGNYITLLKQVLKTLLPLLKNYIRSNESQMDCLGALEDMALSEAISPPDLMKTLHHLYDIDILEETTILRWNREVPTMMGDEAKRRDIRKKMAKLIQWLEEAEEESSDEESD